MPLLHLAANPRNPRGAQTGLDDLASIVDQQLQPVSVVSRTSWLRLWPDDSIGDAKYVVVNGCRRLAAAHHFGRPSLDVVIRDSLATSASAILAAAITENIARKNFDVMEEARAVDLLANELSSAAEAARRLKRTEGWVSQRRVLLRLHPDLQAVLVGGSMSVRIARELAVLPADTQDDAWRARTSRDTEANLGGQPTHGAKPAPAGSQGNLPRKGRPRLTNHEVLARAVRKAGYDVDALADVLFELLGEEGVSTLTVLLENRRALPR
ncbi:ParB/RepB/Spo0J family partition protein [Rhodococcoides corynebacterioides]|uniref:ParB/RepB/Spo0J family partition protein n=1 Tax=Rhodococcoides corynebacterioides TaxID=53972 RepID=UPI003AE6E94A